MKLRGTMQINEQGHLTIGGCDTVQLAKHFGTPLYVLDEECLRDACRRYRRAFSEHYHNALTVYAGKALLNLAICQIIKEEGLGLDVVSGGELFTALAAGFPPERIFFHGNNKTEAEIALGLDRKIGYFMVDNFHEIELLSRLASRRHVTANVILRIAPGIEAHTHEFIQTGQIDSKFGFTLENGDALLAVKKVIDEPTLSLRGIHCHIGSQIFELESYVLAAKAMVAFMKTIRDRYQVSVDILNMGGGLGIYYVPGDAPPTIEEYVSTVSKAVSRECEDLQLPKPMLIVEPGRSIVGPAGTTLYTVGATKQIPGVRTYVAVDGGMADNIRPALYNAKYEAIVANKARNADTNCVSLTGKCCESGDMLAWDLELASCQAGDIIAVPATGAYCYSMASNYNRLGRPAMVLVKDGQARMIVRRETYSDLISHDLLLTD